MSIMNKCNTGGGGEKNSGYRKVQLHELEAGLEACILNNYFKNKVVSEVIIAASCFCNCDYFFQLETTGAHLSQ